MRGDPERYFDHNGSTPMHPEVVGAVTAFLCDVWGNAGAGHAEGGRAREAIGIARDAVAAAVGARSAEVVFTSGGTESNNWALRGVAEVAGTGHFVVGRHEHPSILRTAEFLEYRGFRVTWLEPDESGAVRVEDVEAALEPDTKLVTLMFANNETGVLQPVAEVGRLCRERQVRFHVDAVCGLGKARIDVHEIGCDLISLSAHKAYGPKGVGALVVRGTTVLAPLVRGCGQQNGRRSGTENTLGAVGFGRATELLQRGALGSHERVEAMRDRLWEGLSARFPDVRRNGTGPFLPNTLSVWFPGASALALQARLADDGFSVGSSTSIHSGVPEPVPSHVLRAMGYPAERARCSLRFSLGAGNTPASVDALVEATERAFRSCAPLLPVPTPTESDAKETTT